MVVGAAGENRNIAEMNREEIQHHFARTEQLVFARQYFDLDKAGQLKVYGLLNPEQQKVIWGAYETIKRQKENPFYGLSKPELKRKYLGLPEAEQKEGYAKLDDAQKKMVWEIFEEEKKKKEAKARGEAVANDSEDELDDIPHEKKPVDEPKDEGVDLIKVPKNLRKNMLDAMSNEDLVTAYQRIKKEQDRKTIWAELSPQQQEIITTAAEVRRNEQALLKAQNGRFVSCRCQRTRQGGARKSARES